MSFKPKTFKARVVHRLKISQGHLRKVIEMVETERYCIDVIHQTQAISNALKEVETILLENHLNHCVTEAIAEGKKDKAIAEVMQVFKKIN